MKTIKREREREFLTKRRNMCVCVSRDIICAEKRDKNPLNGHVERKKSDTILKVFFCFVHIARHSGAGEEKEK